MARLSDVFPKTRKHEFEGGGYALLAEPDPDQWGAFQRERVTYTPAGEIIDASGFDARVALFDKTATIHELERDDGSPATVADIPARVKDKIISGEYEPRVARKADNKKEGGDHPNS